MREESAREVTHFQWHACSLAHLSQFCLKDPVLPIARCDLLAAIFVMLKSLKLLFAARIELFNNRHVAPVKTKTTTGHAKHNGQYWAFNLPVLQHMRACTKSTLEGIE